MPAVRSTADILIKLVYQRLYKPWKLQQRQCPPTALGLAIACTALYNQCVVSKLLLKYTIPHNCASNFKRFKRSTSQRLLHQCAAILGASMALQVNIIVAFLKLLSHKNHSEAIHLAQACVYVQPAQFQASTTACADGVSSCGPWIQLQASSTADCIFCLSATLTKLQTSLLSTLNGSFVCWSSRWLHRWKCLIALLWKVIRLICIPA